MKLWRSMEPWEIELENKISSHRGDMSPKSNGSKGLLLSVALLCTLLLVVFSYKTRPNFRSWVQSHFKIQESLVPKKPGAVDPEPKKQDKDGSVSGQDEQIKNLTKKINIMGIVTNENFSILQKKDPKAKFIFITHDWELSGTPENIEIKKEDLGFVEDNVKRQ